MPVPMKMIYVTSATPPPFLQINIITQTREGEKMAVADINNNTGMKSQTTQENKQT